MDACRDNALIMLIFSPDRPQLASAIQPFCERFGMTKSDAIRELISRGIEAATEIEARVHRPFERPSRLKSRSVSIPHCAQRKVAVVSLEDRACRLSLITIGNLHPGQITTGRR